jgi:hypothetical protein
MSNLIDSNTFEFASNYTLYSKVAVEQHKENNSGKINQQFSFNKKVYSVPDSKHLGFKRH